MMPSIPPWRGNRTIHTPAICDCGHRMPETRDNSGLAGSTVLIEPVHIRGLLESAPIGGAAPGTGGRS